MPAFDLEEVLKATGAKVVNGAAKAFSDVVTDTRKIAEKVLFVALKGERFNGEDFAADDDSAADAGSKGDHNHVLMSLTAALPHLAQKRPGLAARVRSHAPALDFPRTHPLHGQRTPYKTPQRRQHAPGTRKAPPRQRQSQKPP